MLNLLRTLSEMILDLYLKKIINKQMPLEAKKKFLILKCMKLKTMK
jgi:hypothetical protein